jgi:hypothetical protein
MRATRRTQGWPGTGLQDLLPGRYLQQQAERHVFVSWMLTMALEVRRRLCTDQVDRFWLLSTASLAELATGRASGTLM